MSLQVVGFVVEKRKDPVVAAPKGVPAPLSVALADVTRVAAEVVTAGAASVVKDNTAPNEVPMEFWAMAQKKYVVAPVRPVRFCVKLCGVVPLPRLEPPVAGKRVPKVSLQVPGLVVEYRTHAVVASAAGFTVPPTSAAADVTFEAAVEVTVGEPGVKNVNTEPKPMPLPFCAMTQK